VGFDEAPRPVWGEERTGCLTVPNVVSKCGSNEPEIGSLPGANEAEA
jgi:hypothetical protein